MELEADPGCGVNLIRRALGHVRGCSTAMRWAQDSYHKLGMILPPKSSAPATAKIWPTSMPATAEPRW